MRTRAVSAIFASIFVFNQTASIAAECVAKSGAQTQPLLELYTSEGCSSCPPADQWLSGLKNSKTQVTPLAFHVDYWDYIGWKDKFARPEFSAKQRTSAALGGTGFVYTPQFTLNGQDFRGVNSARFAQTLDSIAQQPAKAQLSLQAKPQANGEIQLIASAQAVKPDAAKNAQVFIAIYQNQLSSQVNAGENSGRELKHDFIVREFWGGFPLNGQFSKNITLKSEWKNRDAGAVIFVQDLKTGEVWQSLRLPFCTS